MKQLNVILVSLILSMSMQLAVAAPDNNPGAATDATDRAERQAARQSARAERRAAREAARAERRAARAERRAQRAARKAAKDAKAATGQGRNNRSTPQDPAAALTALARHNEALLTENRVVGTGVSWLQDGTPIIKIFTAGRNRNLPDTLDGIPVVRKNVGRFYALNLDCDTRAGAVGCDGEAAARSQDGTGETEAVAPSDWHERPVPIGVSIGDALGSGGTLGCRVSAGCHNYALSNSHIVADSTLLQPSTPDGGLDPDDQIAELFAAVPIVLGTGAGVANKVDAALFEVEVSQVGTTTRDNGYGEPRVTPLEPSLDLGVMKYGRSSAMTTGYIDTIAATVIVRYADGDARFVDQFIIRSDTRRVDFSLPGDSGSLIVAAGGADERRPVGLLFASGKGFSIANPINEVLAALNVDIDGEY